LPLARLYDERCGGGTVWLLQAGGGFGHQVVDHGLEIAGLLALSKALL
jgi:hypothetical protein